MVSPFSSDTAQLCVAGLSGSVDVMKGYGIQACVGHDVNDIMVPMISVCVLASVKKPYDSCVLSMSGARDKRTRLRNVERQPTVPDSGKCPTLTSSHVRQYGKPRGMDYDVAPGIQIRSKTPQLCSKITLRLASKYISGPRRSTPTTHAGGTKRFDCHTLS